MGLLNTIGFTSNKVELNSELPDIFPLSMTEKVFIEMDLKALFNKILTDTLERTHGITPEQQPLLFDNVHKGSTQDGLITMLVDAMYNKAELFLVYNSTLKVLRKATAQEQDQIRQDYQTGADSGVGLYVSFKNFDRKDILLIYSSIEYCLISGLYKGVNLSKAILFKMDSLRSAVGSIDSSEVVTQAGQISAALSNGKNALMDSKDMIEMMSPDMSAIDKGMGFLNQKRSLYLGLPKSYISGETHGGLGDSGTGETKAIDRGLKAFYYSIIKPVVEKLFSVKTTFKSNDLSHLPQALEVLKVFEITEDNYVNAEEKRMILTKAFDLESQA